MGKPNLQKYDYLMPRVLEAIKALRTAQVPEDRIVLPTKLAKKLRKNDHKYLGMRIIASDEIPPMVMSEKCYGQFREIPAWDTDK